MTLAASINEVSSGGIPIRIPLGDVMKFEILMNEKGRIWVFHDQVLPYRLAWVEFDPVSGHIELMPHDMRHGILYADVPSALHARMRGISMACLYQTEGEKVTGFQKAPVQIKRGLQE